MKKIIFTLLAIAFAGAANAQFSGAPAQTAGGFEGPGVQSNATTVKDAHGARDDTPVVLTGKIVNSLGDEKYTFRDDTGEIMIEIDDDEWHGLKVTPENTIEIFGEVDKEVFEPTKIDVKSFNVK